MQGYLLQDWVGLTLASSIAEITQDESEWLEVGPFSNLVLWTEARSVKGSTNIRLHFETSPSKDEVLFSGMGHVDLTASTTPTITKFLAAQNPAVTLARWLRWKIIPGGGSATEWGATFRVHCAVSPLRGVAP